MRQAPEKQYTHSHVVSDDGTVTFKCSDDQDQWPWLALTPFDPIVVQTINFWASVETAAARGTWDPKKWSALTQTEWSCGEPGVEHAVRGIGEALGSKGSPRFQLRFFDANEALVYTISGTGVVFENRDFESWRKKAKNNVVPAQAPINFEYADARAVGVSEQKESFLSPLNNGGTLSAQAYITRENGFPPAHPYQSGSGDHVNATHLADVARQFVNLLLGGGNHVILGGIMHFDHYVELGHPFDIIQTRDQVNRKTISMIVEQAGRPCARIRMIHS